MDEGSKDMLELPKGMLGRLPLQMDEQMPIVNDEAAKGITDLSIEVNSQWMNPGKRHRDGEPQQQERWVGGYAPGGFGQSRGVHGKVRMRLNQKQSVVGSSTDLTSLPPPPPPARSSWDRLASRPGTSVRDDRAPSVPEGFSTMLSFTFSVSPDHKKRMTLAPSRMSWRRSCMLMLCRSTDCRRRLRIDLTTKDRIFHDGPSI